MTSDLATRVQRFIDGGAASITIDEVAHRRPLRDAPGPKYSLLAAAVVLLLVVVIGGVVMLDGDGPKPHVGVASVRLSLEQVPDGVSVQQFGKQLAFVVRDGKRVTVFDTNVHHLPGERALWWCPNERLFASPTHAEIFARSGEAIGGPASAGLDRLRSEVRHGKLIVDPSAITAGAKGNAHTADGISGSGIGSWDSGPESFCSGAYRATSSAEPTAVLNVEALASGSYDQKQYSVPAGLIEIRLTGASGILFTFDDPRYRYCFLATDQGARHTCRVALGPGQYVVYDSVPGHQQAGYEATIQATAPTATTSTQATSTQSSG